MTIVYNPIKNMIINLESFASNINHEFKTSISEVLSSLELAKMT
jgi:signal transduction histidine kinase